VTSSACDYAQILHCMYRHPGSYNHKCMVMTRVGSHCMVMLCLRAIKYPGTPSVPSYPVLVMTLGADANTNGAAFR
jgi:hypothetical protein